MNYTPKEIDELSEGIIREFFKSYNTPPERVDIEALVTNYLNMPIIYETYAEKDSDCLGFTSNGKRSLTVLRDNQKVEITYPSRTVVIDTFLKRKSEEGRCRFTIAHEAAHYIFDRDHGGKVEAHFFSAFDAERNYTLDELRQRMNSCEWQTNAMAAALLMPRFLVVQSLKKHSGRESLPIYGDSVLSQRSKLVMSKMAKTLGVSYSSLVIRMRGLKLFEHRDISEYVTRILNLRGGIT